MMKLFGNMRSLLAALGVCAALTGAAEPTGQAKWLVLDPITYQTGVNRVAFEGIDNLLLTTLVQAKKYKCLDRDAYRTAAREQGFGAQVELVPAGYSMRGEIVQFLATGKSRQMGAANCMEYLATISLRVNDLRTQQPYESETLRVKQYCETPKDMLVSVVRRLALAILMRDYPLKIMDVDDDEFTLNYGKDFLNVGEQYEIRKRKEIKDEDTGDIVFKEKVTGVCEVTDTGSSTSTAKLISGKGKEKSILRFYDAEGFTPNPAPQIVVNEEKDTPKSIYPTKKPRIAVAPFISKYAAFSVWGMTITSRKWMDDAADHVNNCLTQSGSFRVLDRQFGPEIDAELGRITNDPNANPNDVCRLCQKLAADYLVVAEVIFSNVASPGKDFATGLPLPPPSAIFAEVRFRCVRAPTTEMIWAEAIQLDASQFGGTAEAFSSDSAANAAVAIADAIQAKLAPADFKKVQARRAAEAKQAAEAAAKAAAQKKTPASAPAGLNVGF